jgi:polyferredoxin
MACIGCGLCIDACNSIMPRFGLPRELITYDSTNNQIARSKGRKTRIRLIRPRTIAYMALLAIVAGVMVFSLSTRSQLEVNVIPDRQPLFVKLSDGSIRNGYTFKILNMRREPKTYLLATDGLNGGEISVLGKHAEAGPYAELSVAPDDVGSFKLFVKAPAESLSGKSTDFRFYLIDLATREAVDHPAVFNGPASRDASEHKPMFSGAGS